MDVLMVLKLVIVPPSQRSTTKYWPHSFAVSLTHCCACFLVPTKMTLPPLRTVTPRKSHAVSSCARVFERSMMWMPLRASKMKGFILGFQRFVWCPKWTPESNNSFTPILNIFPLVKTTQTFVAQHPAEHGINV